MFYAHQQVRWTEEDKLPHVEKPRPFKLGPRSLVRICNPVLCHQSPIRYSNCWRGTTLSMCMMVPPGHGESLQLLGLLFVSYS